MAVSFSVEQTTDHSGGEGVIPRGIETTLALVTMASSMALSLSPLERRSTKKRSAWCIGCGIMAVAMVSRPAEQAQDCSGSDVVPPEVMGVWSRKQQQLVTAIERIESKLAQR